MSDEPKTLAPYLQAMLEEWKKAPQTQEPTSMSTIERDERKRDFDRVCPLEFSGEILRTELLDGEAFDRVAGWDGKFPGPLAVGPTGTAKTRAVWRALAELYVGRGLAFDWFPVKRLLHSMAWYEDQKAGDEFFRMLTAYPIVMVDDIEKINWDFSSQAELLFSFYDWVYRNRRPCVTTTNMPREWWTAKMGEAFTRRMFDEAHRVVEFTV